MTNSPMLPPWLILTSVLPSYSDSSVMISLVEAPGPTGTPPNFDSVSVTSYLVLSAVHSPIRLMISALCLSRASAVEVRFVKASPRSRSPCRPSQSLFLRAGVSHTHSCWHLSRNHIRPKACILYVHPAHAALPSVLPERGTQSPNLPSGYCGNCVR